jgi:ERO1-like protein alpha
MLDRVLSNGLNPEDICSEETLLYHVISGIHTSVNMHVSTHYNDIERNTTYPNHEMYMQKIGAYPERLKNLHFLYALVVRAINRVHD